MAGQARGWYGAGGRHPIHFQISAGAALMLGLLDVAGAAAVTAAQRIDGGAAFLGDVAIATTKASEHGINVTGRTAEVRVTGGTIRTSGNQAQGLRVGTENAPDNTALGASVFAEPDHRDFRDRGIGRLCPRATGRRRHALVHVRDDGAHARR